MRRTAKDAERLVIIEHDPVDPPTAIVACLDRQGVDHEVRRMHAGDPLPNLHEGFGLIAMGGRMYTDESAAHPWLAAERTLIKSAISQDVPFLGVCLGAQQLALAAGGRLYHRARPEYGWLPISVLQEDELLRGIGASFSALEWHVDSFEPPEDSVVLAERPDGCQVIRVGRCAWGVQFHPEVDGSMLDLWLRETEASERETGAIDPASRHFAEQWRANRDEIEASSSRLCELLVSNFVTVARAAQEERAL
jgi:GMP synthase (glutamine-hydrolysing)